MSNGYQHYTDPGRDRHVHRLQDGMLLLLAFAVAALCFVALTA